MRFPERQTNFRAITEEVDGKNVRRLRGYPILFDVPGKPYRASQWVEKIDKKALEEVDLSQLVLLIDHNTTWVLGKVGKNMRAEVDDTGLFIEVTLGETWVDDYIFDRVQRELMDGMSFWFDSKALIATNWETKTDVILKINEVYEVSILVFPAYEDTAIIAEEEVPEAPPEEMPKENPPEDEAKKAALLKLIELL
jgi:HK97 family phage prohead protease